MTTRFVVLHHSGIAEPHFDLMFDIGPDAPLITWRSPGWPIDRPVVITRLPDHRREYLTYQGEVSKDRGCVERVAEGWCEVEMSENRWNVKWGDPALAALIINRQIDARWIASPVAVIGSAHSPSVFQGEGRGEGRAEPK